jgi:hypothetical protein
MIGTPHLTIFSHSTTNTFHRLDFLVIGANGRSQEFATHVEKAANDLGQILGIV